MIAIADYDTGNLRSVSEALRRAGAEFVVTSDIGTLRRADKVILPGVGEASASMARLRERGLDAVLPTLTCPVLGICVGLQLMCRSSDEGGGVDCMGIFPVRVVRLPEATPEGRWKVPHMGWNTVGGLRPAFQCGARPRKLFRHAVPSGEERRSRCADSGELLENEMR